MAESPLRKLWDACSNPRKTILFFLFENIHTLINKKFILDFNLLAKVIQKSTNVLFTLNRKTHSSKTLLRVVRFNVNKTLVNKEM